MQQDSRLFLLNRVYLKTFREKLRVCLCLLQCVSICLTIRVYFFHIRVYLCLFACHFVLFARFRVYLVMVPICARFYVQTHQFLPCPGHTKIDLKKKDVNRRYLKNAWFQDEKIDVNRLAALYARVCAVCTVCTVCA